MSAACGDKRLVPMFVDQFWCARRSERQWHYCKYCCREVPTFKFDEGVLGSLHPERTMRCCWECGSGLEVLHGEEAAA